MVHIPMELLNLHDDGFHLLVEVVVFEHPFKAVLDTGASRTVFDKTTVERFLENDIQLIDTELQSTGLGTNTMQSFSLVVPDLQIGVPTDGSGLKTTRRAWHRKNFPVAVLDLSTINYAYEQMEMEPVIGVIGGDILVQYGGIIDYRKMVLKLGERRMKRRV